MILKIFLISLIFFNTITFQLHFQTEQANQDMIVGGYRKLDPLSSDATTIDDFIKSNFPELNQASLIDTQVQTVYGYNYKFKYSQDSTVWTTTVYENP